MTVRELIKDLLACRNLEDQVEVRVIQRGPSPDPTDPTELGSVRDDKLVPIVRVCMIGYGDSRPWLVVEQRALDKIPFQPSRV